MLDELTAGIMLPVTRFRASGEYSDKKAASGMEYLLLKMIGFGKGKDSDFKVSDLMGIFSLTSDMTPFVLAELERLAHNGWVKKDTAKITRDTPVKMLSLTPTGNEVADTGLEVQNSRKLETTVYYFPARKKPFTMDFDVSQLKEMHKQIEPSTDQLREFIDENRELFGLSEVADLSAGFNPSNEKTFLYRDQVQLVFNEMSGTYMVDEGRTAADTTYLRLKFKGSDILEQVHPATFELPADCVIKAAGWKPCEETDGFNLMLPAKMTSNGGHVVDDPAITAGFGCDAMRIVHMGEGYRYRFVTREISIDGFFGTKPVHLVQWAKMNAEEIRTCLDRITSGLDLQNMADLETLVSICREIQGPSLLTDILASRTAGYTPDEVKNLVGDLCTMAPRNWGRYIVDGFAGASDEVKDICSTIVNGGQ